MISFLLFIFMLLSFSLNDVWWISKECSGNISSVGRVCFPQIQVSGKRGNFAIMSWVDSHHYWFQYWKLEPFGYISLKNKQYYFFVSFFRSFCISHYIVLMYLNYVVYITFTGGKVMQVATVEKVGQRGWAESGGMVTSKGNDKWITNHPYDLIFELSSSSILTLQHVNFAEGPSSTVGCMFRSTYTAVQVCISSFLVFFLFLHFIFIICLCN